jgi:four helix bundle protein
VTGYIFIFSGLIDSNLKISGKMVLEDLEIYQLSMELGENTWLIVNSWKYFEKDTIGKQFVRASDSVAANISEGFGRYHYSENRHFLFYARGSLYEAKTWLKKARNRDLVSKEVEQQLLMLINKLGIKLNNYIKSTGITPTSKK